MSYAVDWVVKASKLCNLRCKYCYEWEELADPERMSLSLWKDVLSGLREHLQAVSKETFHAGMVQADIIWHGGEPLLLPVSYFEDVLALQKDIFPADWLESGLVQNTMQTNLYKAPEKTLELLKAHGFSLGVSYDATPGTRVTAAGKTTEGRVRENIARVQQMGFDPGAIVVLAGHTAPRLIDLYRELRGQVRDMKLLPLFNGPDSRPMDGLEADSETLVDALAELFEYWLEDGCAMSVDPLERYFTAVLNTRLGLATRAYDRRRYGDNVMIVNIDGALRTPGASYDDPPLGNLARQSISEILSGSVNAATLDREDHVRERVCGNCRYRGGCNTYPLFASDDGGMDEARCPIAAPLMARMDRHLDEIGIDDAQLESLFRTMMSSQSRV